MQPRFCEVNEPDITLHLSTNGRPPSGLPSLVNVQPARVVKVRPARTLHLIRFGVRITSLREVSGPPLRDHGVLAPNAELRALVVPQEPEPPAQAAPPAECEAICAHHRPLRLSWAQLLKRVFELDLEHWPLCGGELKIVAAILEQPVIEKILTHLGLQADCGRMTAPARGHAPQEGLAPASASAACRARAPPRAPARGPQLQAA